MTKKKRRSREREPGTTKHHSIAKSRGGVDYPPNNNPTDHQKHMAVHVLFDNKYVIEKIEQIISMDEAILTDYFRKIIMDVLEMDYKDVVIQEAFKNRQSYKNFPNTRTHG